MKKVNIDKTFLPLYTSKKRYFFLTGGRGSTKTFSVHDFVARLTYEKGHGILFTRYTLTSVENTVVKEFKDTLERLGITHDFHITKKVITNKRTGSFIYFSGIKTNSGDQTANLKSLPNITTWVIEEGEDFNDEKTFDTIDDSIRQLGIHNRVIWIMNPTTKEHFVYERWVKKWQTQQIIDGFPVMIGNHPEVEHIHSTYLIATKYLAKSFLKKTWKWRTRAKTGRCPIEKRELSGDEWDYAKKWYLGNYLGGWKDKADGVIFENWKLGNFDHNLLPIFGLDWGYNDPTTIIRTALDKNLGKYYLKKELYKRELSSNQIIEHAQRIVGDGFLICDNADKRGIRDLREVGMNVYPCEKGANSIVNGILKMKDYELIIDEEDCDELVEELNNYVWDDKKSKKPIDDYNHCFVGSTLITTIKGQVPIKEIKEGDLVLTSNGYRPVLARFDNGVKAVNDYSMLFGTFSVSLTSTSNHKIKTKSKWKSIKSITEEDSLFIHKHSTEKNTSYIQEKGISQKAAKECIESFGNITTGKFQKASMSTIKTMTHTITKLKTSKLLSVGNTLENTERKDLKMTKIGLVTFIQKELKSLKNGIHHPRVLSGIENKLSKQVLETGRSEKVTAKCAELNSQRKQVVRNSAQTIVSLNTEELQGLTMRRERVQRAVKNILLTSIQNQKLVAVNVGEERNEQVYDLMVDGTHEYFANGVLVHNCIDPARYTLRRHLRY